MHTYNIGFSGSSTEMFHRLLEIADGLKMLEGIKVAVVTTIKTKDELLAIEGVSFVEEDVQLPLTAEAWHLKRMSTQFLPLPTNPYITNNGVGTTVYLVDGHVNLAHPELTDANIRVLYEDIDVATDMHGTIMASMIVGKTVGVSPAANLVSVGIPMNTSVTISKILTAFDAIINDALRPAVSVVNCSWSIPKSQILDTKITELQNAGIVVVASAGNSGVAADVVSPAGLDTVIGVGACDAFDRVIPWDTGASNWGPEVDIFAPGIDVPVPDMNNDEILVSGTSISSALVAGVVAQFITKNPTYSAASVQNEVIQKAVMNVLFWDEEIYATTPNRLIQNCRITQAEMWGYIAPLSGYHPVRNGEYLNIDITFMNPIVQVNYEATTEVIRPIQPFDWVTYQTVGNTAQIAISPVNVPVGKYIVAIRGLDSNGNLISAVWLRIGVYDTSENELNEVAEEKYLVYISETDSVQLTTHLNCCDTGCPKGSFCCTFTGQVTDYACVDDSSGAVNCC